MTEIEKLKCPMCKNVFNSTVSIPISVPCGHTYCIECIENEYMKKKSFTCTKCKIKYLTHYSKFQTNYTVLNIRRYKVKYENFCDLDNYSISYKNKLQKSEEIFFSFYNNKFYDHIYEKEIERKNRINEIYEKRKIEKDKNKIERKESKKEESNKKYEKKKSSEKKRNYLVKRQSLYYSQYPSLYNYFEIIKYIYNYIKDWDKIKNIKNKTFKKIFPIIYKPLFLILCIIINSYLFNNFRFGIFFLFCSILYEPEEDLYDITKKLKMFTVLGYYIFFEDGIYKIGIGYLFNSISLFNNIFSASITILNILILGSESTLNGLVGKILKGMSMADLLLR